MKALIFFIIPFFAYTQDISPYYPTKQTDAYRGNEATQLTYYDSMFVQGLIPNFLSNNMGMVQMSSDMDSKTSTIKQVYQDSFSTGKLVFQIKTDVITSNVPIPEIVTSIKITGTSDRVKSFFINYWGTKIDWDSEKSDVERKQMQDIIRFYHNSGKPYITITNSTFKNKNDFEIHFNKLLNENQ